MERRIGVIGLCASLLVGAAFFAPLSAHAGMTVKQWQDMPYEMQLSYLVGMTDGWQEVMWFFQMSEQTPTRAPAFPGRQVDCLVARQMSRGEVFTIVERFIRHQGAKWGGGTAPMARLVGGAIQAACGFQK